MEIPGPLYHVNPTTATEVRATATARPARLISCRPASVLAGPLGGWCFSAGPSDPQVMLEGMSPGLTPRRADMFATTTSFVEPRVSADSIYALLHRQCFELFPDEMFADLFMDVGRHSVPPTIVAVVMVLQRLEGCSDREAVERFT